MGENKALLRLAGETLVERALGKLGQVCQVTAIAGGVPELARYGRLVVDRFEGEGPLGGIVSALEQSGYEWNLFLAVDMPAIPVAALRQLLAVSGAPRQVTLAVAAGRVQPLCGVYSRRALPVLRAELLKGNRRVRAAVEATGSYEYWEAADPAWFANLNTPQDFKDAERLVSTDQGK